MHQRHGSSRELNKMANSEKSSTKGQTNTEIFEICDRAVVFEVDK